MGKTVPPDTRDKEPRANKTLFVGAGPDGVARLYARSRLSHFDLVAGAGVPMKTILAKSEMGFRHSAFTASVVGLLGLLVAAYAARRLTAPLRSLLVNRCGNAVKFTTSGEVAMVVEKLATTPDQRTKLRFSVRGTGRGMAAQQVAALFTPFTQGDVSTTREFGGTGLGLALSKQLVELMGGDIGVRSTRHADLPRALHRGRHERLRHQTLRADGAVCRVGAVGRGGPQSAPSAPSALRSGPRLARA